MKCIQNLATGETRRVTEIEVPQYLRYGWRYISKSMYKELQIARLVDDRRLSKKEARRV